MQKLDSEIWQELGVTEWKTRPGFDDLLSKIKQIEEAPASTEFLQQPDLVAPEQAVAEAVNQLPAGQKYLVLIGANLTQTWQNQAGLPHNQAWLLWQNILNYHLETPEQLVFFDTATILDEEAGFDVVDKLSELGVDRVFSMDSEHFLTEFLAESIQVVNLPSFEQMLEQPQLKANVYQAFSEYF